MAYNVDKVGIVDEINEVIKVNKLREVLKRSTIMDDQVDEVNELNRVHQQAFGLLRMTGRCPSRR